MNDAPDLFDAPIAGIGHNNPPSDDARARPLPGRDRYGLMRPARNYAFERAVARMNREARKARSES